MGEIEPKNARNSRRKEIVGDKTYSRELEHQHRKLLLEDGPDDKGLKIRKTRLKHNAIFHKLLGKQTGEHLGNLKNFKMNLGTITTSCSESVQSGSALMDSRLVLDES